MGSLSITVDDLLPFRGLFILLWDGRGVSRILEGFRSFSGGSRCIDSVFWDPGRLDSCDLLGSRKLVRFRELCGSCEVGGSSLVVAEMVVDPASLIKVVSLVDPIVLCLSSVPQALGCHDQLGFRRLSLPCDRFWCPKPVRCRYLFL